jgi:hypothetical protein
MLELGNWHMLAPCGPILPAIIHRACACAAPLAVQTAGGVQPAAGHKEAGGGGGSGARAPCLRGTLPSPTTQLPRPHAGLTKPERGGGRVATTAPTPQTTHSWKLARKHNFARPAHPRSSPTASRAWRPRSRWPCPRPRRTTTRSTWKRCRPLQSCRASRWVAASVRVCAAARHGVWVFRGVWGGCIQVQLGRGASARLMRTRGQRHRPLPSLDALCVLARVWCTGEGGQAVR